MFQPGLLKGKRILVTGGGTGLGREIAGKYLELGADLYLCGRRKAVLDETAAALVAAHGGSVKAHAVDIRDATAVDAMIQSIWDDGGPLTGLVNNAAGNFISRTHLAAFLMADGCEWLTGQTIALDGAGHLAGTGTFYDLRSWTDDDWKRAREMIKAQNDRDKSQR